MSWLSVRGPPEVPRVLAAQGRTRQPLSRRPCRWWNGAMKTDPDQTRWDRVDRRITRIRWLAAITLALVLLLSLLLLR